MVRMTGAIRRRKAMRTKRRRVQRKKARVAKNAMMLRRNGLLIRMTQIGLNQVTLSQDGNGSAFITPLSAGVLPTDSMSNTVQFGNSYIFKLSSVIDSSDLTNLFDKYKINGVKLKIMYQADSASVGGSGVFPIFNYCYDGDDATIPTSLNQVESKAKARSVVLSANKPVSIFIKPKVASYLYSTVSGAPVPGYSVTKAPYINSTYSDVQHYGLKTWINNFYAPTNANNQITVQTTYYLSLRDPQ